LSYATNETIGCHTQPMHWSMAFDETVLPILVNIKHMNTKLIF